MPKNQTIKRDEENCEKEKKQKVFDKETDLAHM
jgi:hypothetical protein